MPHRLAASVVLLAGALPVGAQTAPTLPRLERVSTVGCADCGDTRQFTRIDAVAVSPDGRMWIADRDEPRLRVFASDGAPLRAFGRRGKGPGEFTGIERIVVGRDGIVTVVDETQSRVERVDTLGRHVTTIRTPGFPFDAEQRPGTEDLYLLFSRFRPGTSSIAILRRSADSVVTIVGPIRDFPSADAPEEVRSIAVNAGGVLAWANGETRYLIRVRGTDGRQTDLTREIPRVRRSEAGIDSLVAQASVEQRMVAEKGGSASVRPTSDVRKHFELRPHLQWAALRYDGTGRLWVRTARGDAEHTVFDVFSGPGAFLGEVTLAGNVTDLQFAGPYAVTAGVSPAGWPQVTLWRLR